MLSFPRGAPSAAGGFRSDARAARRVDALEAPARRRPSSIIFTSTDCPVSNRYAPEVRAIVESSRPGRGLRLVYPTRPTGEVRSVSTWRRSRTRARWRRVRDPDHALVKFTKARRSRPKRRHRESGASCIAAASTIGTWTSASTVRRRPFTISRMPSPRFSPASRSAPSRRRSAVSSRISRDDSLAARGADCGMGVRGSSLERGDRESAAYGTMGTSRLCSTDRCVMCHHTAARAICLDYLRRCQTTCATDRAGDQKPLHATLEGRSVQRSIHRTASSERSRDRC